MKILLPFLCVLSIAASCTFRQDVNFRKNWSGDITCVIDMSQMATLLESTGDPIDLMGDQASKSKISRLKEIPGIKKVKARETEKGVYRISYSFRDLAALNKSGNVLFADDNEPIDFTYFSLKDKNALFFTIPFQKKATEPGDSIPDSSISENFIYELRMNFPWKVEKLETTTDATISSDRKQVFFKSDIFTLTSGDFEPGILIRFEK